MPDIGNPDRWDALLSVNLNHLLYFWAVGRSGSVSSAARTLGLSQPSVSEQVRALERRLGATLLRRTGRGVELTAAGQRAMRYAEEVVGICGELVRAVPMSEPEELPPVIVGATDAIPKIIVRTLLEPLLHMTPPVRIVCREWRVDYLLSELTLQRLDFVISDIPIDPATRTGMRTLLAGASNITMCGNAAVARRLRPGFPRSLQGQPLLMPVPGSALRASLDRWFALHRISAPVLIEMEDRGLLHHFAEFGYGVVAAATADLPILKRQFGLHSIGEMAGVRDEYYVVTIDRAHQHPALKAIIEPLAARTAEVRKPAGPDAPARRRGRSRTRDRAG